MTTKRELDVKISEEEQEEEEAARLEAEHK
jgi:hypothetical protein